MRNVLLVILSVLYCQINIAQVNGTATYKLQIAFDDEALQIDKKFGYIQKAIDVCELLEYKLIFNVNESNFYLQKNDTLDKVSVNIANILSDAPKLSYQNIEKNIYLYDFNADGVIFKYNEFVVSDTIKRDWIMTTETKLIDNYLCYKATTTSHIQKGEQISTEIITAWFCPTLPFSFGPTKYAGLPGLIVQLIEKNIAFTLKSFELDRENNISVVKPVAKKYISQSEYYRILSERMQTLESMSKK